MIERYEGKTAPTGEMLSKIDAIIDAVLANEAGYVNHPADRGGETNYGITASVARRNGWDGPMRDLPIEVARAIYFRRYITEPSFDRVVMIDEDIGLELIDTGVNMGPSRAAEFLQRWLNGFNASCRYEMLFVDGRLGDVSLLALRGFLAWRGNGGKVALLRGMNAVQGARYLSIVEARPDQRTFLFGWVMNRVHL